MVKSGLIVGAISLVVIVGATVITPLCTPCAAILLGLVAGYLACEFDKPATADMRLRSSAVAGAIAGAFGIPANLIGGVLNATVLSWAYSQGYATTVCGTEAYYDPEMIWGGQIGAACCLAPFNLVLMAVLGLLGGVIWHQIQGRIREPQMPGESIS